MNEEFERLQKALEQLKPKLTRVTMTGSYQEGYLDAVHDVKELFSVFLKDYDKQMVRLHSAEQKNVEYAKLVAKQAQEYAAKLDGMVHVPRKQFQENWQKLEDWIIKKHWGEFDPELVFILEQMRNVFSEAFSQKGSLEGKGVSEKSSVEGQK